MHPSMAGGENGTTWRLFAGWKYAEENGPGLFGSVLLHGIVAIFVLGFYVGIASKPAETGLPRMVPVDLVRFGAETASPPEERKALVPQQRSARPNEASSPTLEAVAPDKVKPAPADPLAAKLRALAKLRQTGKTNSEDGTGVSNLSATSDGAVSGDRATYSVKDIIRAQVERRWSLNLRKLGGRNYAILIHIVVKRDGTVVSSEIVDNVRAKDDPLYRDIALSARNAVLLSSPLTLPPGDYGNSMSMTLDLYPRDTLR